MLFCLAPIQMRTGNSYSGMTDGLAGAGPRCQRTCPRADSGLPVSAEELRFAANPRASRGVKSLRLARLAVSQRKPAGPGKNGTAEHDPNAVAWPDVVEKPDG